jgi:hypothetical protein
MIPAETDDRTIAMQTTSGSGWRGRPKLQTLRPVKSAENDFSETDELSSTEPTQTSGDLLLTGYFLSRGINTSISGIWAHPARHLTEHVVEAVKPMRSVNLCQQDLPGIMPGDQAIRELTYSRGNSFPAEKHEYSIGASTRIPRNGK